MVVMKQVHAWSEPTSWSDLPRAIKVDVIHGRCRSMSKQKHYDSVQARAALRERGCGMASRFSLIALLCPAGCSQAPSQNVLGSFFPAWILCSVVGLCVAIAVRVALGIVKLDKYLLAPPLAYLGVAMAVTLFVWLYQFGQ